MGLERALDDSLDRGFRVTQGVIQPGPKHAREERVRAPPLLGRLERGRVRNVAGRDLPGLGVQQPIGFARPALPVGVGTLSLTQFGIQPTGLVGVTTQLREHHFPRPPVRRVGLEGDGRVQPYRRFVQVPQVRVHDTDVGGGKSPGVHFVRPTVVFERLLPVTLEVVDHSDVVDRRHQLGIDP